MGGFVVVAVSLLSDTVVVGSYVSSLKNAVRTIKKTPAYKEAENAKELKSFGACKESQFPKGPWDPA